MSTIEAGQVLLNAPPTEVLPEFYYKSTGHGPNKNRQTQCQIHQVLEDSSGRLYAPDFGSDRVWILQRRDTELDICGWLQCPPGAGPRHAAINRDGEWSFKPSKDFLIYSRENVVCCWRTLARDYRI